MAQPSDKSIPDQLEVEVLEDNFAVKTKEEVKRIFEKSEIAAMKSRYFDQMQFLDARVSLANALKAAVQDTDDPLTNIKNVLDGMGENTDFGEATVKSLKATSSTLMQKINRGFELVEEYVYGFDFQDVGRMAYYDQHGLFVYDRPLKPTERQTSVLSLKTKIA